MPSKLAIILIRPTLRPTFLRCHRARLPHGRNSESETSSAQARWPQRNRRYPVERTQRECDMGKYNFRFGNRNCQIRIRQGTGGVVDVSAHINPDGAKEFPDTTDDYSGSIENELRHLTGMLDYLR